MYAMLTLNIKIIELITEEKHTSMNPLNIIFSCTGANNAKFNKVKITKDKSENTLKCNKTISYDLATQNNNSLALELKRHRVIVADDSLGKLTLPLSWFPTNHLVREWFPFKAANKKVKNAMVLLDIHLDARRAPPFMAPFANLRVFPCWKRPTQTINSDFPVSPPIVYVLSSAEQRVIPLEQLRMIASSQHQNTLVSSDVQPIAQNYTPVIATQSQLNPNLQQQQQPSQPPQMQRTQSLAQPPTRNENQQQQQRQQQQILQPQQTAPIIPSYPNHSSSDNELDKDDDEEQQNAYTFYPPGQPYNNNDIYTPPTNQNDQYNAPTYQPPQANNNENTYTPSIY